MLSSVVYIPTLITSSIIVIDISSFSICISTSLVFTCRRTFSLISSIFVSDISISSIVKSISTKLFLSEVTAGFIIGANTLEKLSTPGDKRSSNNLVCIFSTSISIAIVSSFLTITIWKEPSELIAISSADTPILVSTTYSIILFLISSSVSVETSILGIDNLTPTILTGFGISILDVKNSELGIAL